MSTKHYLFSYGSLQDSEVQLALYNRLLIGQKDSLQGYRIASVKIASLYPIIYKTDTLTDLVKGIVFEITEKELLQSDDYEGEFYERVLLQLTSKQKAWCYISPNKI
ncbi:gamma-glutamylcyclotransferase [Cellulophaga baltica]|uniref:gamma-glutamylcyclotransferase family protein n=1 Tax=Cellulophaga TaxID=104264 RepID=UPI001C07D1DF|nr:gamma-glutamylcyclotransferase family protein [Cellulophaga sp. 1_MG-2023]MBU2997805.1 gamma-glutamylcyclotransferase [Cellulophaga baltica]MDO6769201.1 gamma-glutamylcyclotransferase family protein [Cellulophaga sp. 1_MG-2023]